MDMEVRRQPLEGGQEEFRKTPLKGVTNPRR